MPGVGIGVFLLAVGAVLTFAVTADAEGFDVDAVGVILMIVGGLSVVLSMLFWSTWFGPPREERVIREDHHSHTH